MRTKLYIFALIIMLTGTTNTFAQKETSTLKETSLSLSLYDGSTFGVELDDNSYTKQSEELVIDGIAGGRHYLKVWATGSNKPTFAGYITITEGYTTRAVIDENRAFYIYQKYKFRKERKTDWEHEPGYIGEETNYSVISERDFTDLTNMVKSSPYDGTRVELLKYGIDGSFFTTDMVNSMVKLLTFENYRLEIAKYAYKKTVDKKNYLRIFENFKFDSYIRELKDYIQGYK